MVGRKEELDLLQRRWRQACGGQGQLIMISGEAGIGKSRLLAALENELQGEACFQVRYYCLPHHQDAPLHPVIKQLELAAGFAREEAPADRLNKLRKLLARNDTSAEDIGLLAALLLLPTDKLQVPGLGPQRRKERTFQALIYQIEQSSRKQPLLLLFEDIHWIDPSSREVLDLLLQNLAQLRVLVVVTFRPEFVPLWIGHAGANLMTLSRLDQAEATTLAVQIAHGTNLPPDLIIRIVLQSDGVPLFVEELTAAVMKSAHALLEAPYIAVPATLQASLLSRLDRVPLAKQVAQIGAVVGREFSYALLASVAELSADQLARGLDELVNSGLASRRGLGPDAVYTFKHALVQEATYETLLRSRRAEIHGKIVDSAEARLAVNSVEPGILADHCARAGLIDKAASYYRIAGERSSERLIAEETKGQLERGLQITAKLPVGPSRYRLEAELLIALGRILLPTLGQTHPETLKVLERAVEVCRKADSPTMLARSLYALGIAVEVESDLRSAQAIGEELVSLGRTAGHVGISIAGGVRLGGAMFYQGRFPEARAALSKALSLCDQTEQVLLDVAVASTPNVSSLTFMAWTLAYLGDAERAAAHADQAVQKAQQLGPMPLAFALHGATRTFLALRMERRCQDNAEMQAALAEEQGLPSFLAPARCALGWIKAKQGDARGGLRMITEGVASLAKINHKILKSYVSGLMSDAMAWCGQDADAIAVLDDALELSAQTGGCWLDAELHRRKAELLILEPMSDHVASEQEFQLAINIARKQAAKMLELRAGIGFAQLLHRRRREDEAYAPTQIHLSVFSQRLRNTRSGRRTLASHRTRGVALSLGFASIAVGL